MLVRVCFKITEVTLIYLGGQARPAQFLTYPWCHLSRALSPPVLILPPSFQYLPSVCQFKHSRTAPCSLPLIQKTLLPTSTHILHLPCLPHLFLLPNNLLLLSSLLHSNIPSQQPPPPLPPTTVSSQHPALLLPPPPPYPYYCLFPTPPFPPPPPPPLPPTTVSSQEPPPPCLHYFALRNTTTSPSHLLVSYLPHAVLQVLTVYLVTVWVSSTCPSRVMLPATST